MDNIIHYYTIQVIAILVEDCQSFRDCTSCTGLGDPLCGWCSIENKCSRRSECSNYNETRRWIQDQSICIANFDISPNTNPVEVINQQVKLISMYISYRVIFWKFCDGVEMVKALLCLLSSFSIKGG